MSFGRRTRTKSHLADFGPPGNSRPHGYILFDKSGLCMIAFNNIQGNFRNWEVSVDVLADETNLPAKVTRLFKICPKRTYFVMSRCRGDFGKAPISEAEYVFLCMAAQGLDISNVDLIVYYGHPNNPEIFSSLWSYWTWCKFEFIGPPAVGEVLRSSAEEVVATLSALRPFN
ncbi:hypothetical protein VNO77_22618 [Canavalia gladiata]|uniref:Uncharacterized protein n=1 Tax=Canavalia gladiata TaxID=3824 RepID=A0AAN9L6D4_CANGL